ncbi:hypothetical protein HK101_009358, partial [Irineochytrium annulatum]
IVHVSTLDRRQFPCTEPGCGAQFHRGHDLHRHVRSRHSGARPHRCEVCGKTFARSDSMKKHMEFEEKRVAGGGGGMGVKKEEVKKEEEGAEEAEAVTKGGKRKAAAGGRKVAKKAKVLELEEA